jgi:hypothetical protein
MAAGAPPQFSEAGRIVVAIIERPFSVQLGLPVEIEFALALADGIGLELSELLAVLLGQSRSWLRLRSFRERLLLGVFSDAFGFVLGCCRH